MNKYAQFSGRARRKEYWMFALMNFLIAFGIGFMSGLFKLNPIMSITYSLVTLIPGFSVGVRRMHDTKHSGWWLLCPIINLVFLCTSGTVGENKYGPDPKQPLEKKDDFNLNQAA